jgi:hypothetical protein
VPELCRFYGIVVRIRYRDHPPPHFHAEYGAHRAAIGIDFPAVIAGDLPARALGLVMEWAALRHEELQRAWRQAEARQPVDEIAPL